MGDRQTDSLTRPVDAHLGRQTVSGLMLTVSGQWGRLVLQFVSTYALSRLLLRSQFGLFAEVLVITGFAEQMKDLGLAAATVQRERIEQRQVTGLFWINAAVGVGLALVVAALAPLVAAFYGKPALTGLTLLLSLSFIAGGVAVQHQALLQRQLRFGALAVADTGSIAAGVAAGIACAAAGLGAWSLAIMYVTSAFVRAGILWRFCAWRPGRPSSGSGVREMLSFGGGVSAFNLLNYVSRNGDNLIIGKAFGADALGLYSRAYTLLLMPLQQLNAPLGAVSIPVLSRLRQEPARYRSFYRSAVSGLSLVGLPVVALLIVLAPEVIGFMLSDKYADAVPIFRALGVAGLVQVVANTNGWVYISWGATGRMARWALITRPLVVLSFVCGLPWGVQGVANAYAIGQVLLFVPGFANALKGTPLSLADVGSAVWRPVVLALATACTAFGLQQLVSGPDLFVLVAVGAPSVLVHAGLAWAWPTTRRSILDVVAQRRGGARPAKASVASVATATTATPPTATPPTATPPTTIPTVDGTGAGAAAGAAAPLAPPGMQGSGPQPPMGTERG